MLKRFTELNTKPTLLKLTIATGVGILLLSIFRWTLVDIFTPFLEPFLGIFVFTIFLILLLCSIFYAPIRYKKLKFRSLLPLAINLVVVLVVIFIPFTYISLKINYVFNLNAREKVIDLVINKNLHEKRGSYNFNKIELPENYKSLSRGGRNLGYAQ